MFQGTGANRSLQGIREALSVVVVSTILNPICDFAEPGVLCLSELGLHLFWWNIRLLYRKQNCYLVAVKCGVSRQLLDFLIVLIKPVFMFACISAKLRECSMVYRISLERNAFLTF